MYQKCVSFHQIVSDLDRFHIDVFIQVVSRLTLLKKWLGGNAWCKSLTLEEYCRYQVNSPFALGAQKRLWPSPSPLGSLERGAALQREVSFPLRREMLQRLAHFYSWDYTKRQHWPTRRGRQADCRETLTELDTKSADVCICTYSKTCLVFRISETASIWRFVFFLVSWFFLKHF